ncbi:MAG TPA: hypothetical protein VNQ77_13635 [Frankiaceae bacterium]|nr:hypothetical protein [Frankiaceae bacterium]
MHLARRLWTAFEPIHAATYFAPESREAYEAIGLRGYWRGYFAGRAAAFGRVGPEPVIAAFYGFAPSMVRRALPSIWDLASPEEALRARENGVTAALGRVLGDADVTEATAVLEAAVGRLDLAGRVLAAAHAALPTPDEPLARLWHAAGVLREHRGDGHVAALVAHDVDGCESLVLRASLDIPREVLQPYRGWTDEEWDAATGRLAARGVLGSRELLDSVEAATDAAALRAWADADTDRALAVLEPLARACAGVIPAQSPLGLPTR